MPRIVYVNGRYRAHGEAVVRVEDRGFQFADSVYEVIPVRGGGLIDAGPHLDRLERSLAALAMALPQRRPGLALVMAEVVRRNRIVDGLLYLQVTRGVAPRDHKFPPPGRPTLIVMARAARPIDPARIAAGVGVVLVPDIRWRRCDIKTTALLANVLAKQQAVEAGAYEAWLVDDAGAITEGSSTNAWIVSESGILKTRRADHAILAGITRAALIAIAAQHGITFEEALFTTGEAASAREAFLTSSSNFVLPVTAIDGRPVGDGRPGALTRRLIAAYARHAQRARIAPRGVAKGPRREGALGFPYERPYVVDDLM